MGEEAGYAEVGQYSVALKMMRGDGIPAGDRAEVACASHHRAKAEDPAIRGPIAEPLPAHVPDVPGHQHSALPPGRTDGGPVVRGGVPSGGYLLGLFAIRLFFTNMGVAKASFITNESLFKYSCSPHWWVRCSTSP